MLQLRSHYLEDLDGKLAELYVRILQSNEARNG